MKVKAIAAIMTIVNNFFKKQKIAIFSDLHIGVHQNSRFWHNIAKDWVEWYISNLKKEQIEDVVFCGDFFHTRDEVSVDSLHFGSWVLEQFKDFNVTLITGNHDCYLKDSSEINSLSPFRGWKNVTLIDVPRTVESHGYKFNFIPWGTKLKDFQNAHITFGHFEINNFKTNNYYICDHGDNASDVLEKSDLIITGHFHLRDEKKFNKGTILYVGNPFQMDFNDADTVKGFYVLDICDKTYQFTENTVSPSHYNILLSELVKKQTITDEVRETFKDNLIKLKIDKRITADDTDILLTKLKQLNPLQFTVEYDSSYSPYDISEDKKDLSGIDVQQAIIEFIDLMDINNKSEIINYTLDLYKKIQK